MWMSEEAYSTESRYRMATNESRWSKHCKAVPLDPWNSLSFLSLGVCLAVSLSLAALQSRSFQCAFRSNWASSRRTSDLQVVQELRNWTSLHVPIERTRSWQLEHVWAKGKSNQWQLRTIPHFCDFWLIACMFACHPFPRQSQMVYSSRAKLGPLKHLVTSFKRHFGHSASVPAEGLHRVLWTKRQSTQMTRDDPWPVAQSTLLTSCPGQSRFEGRALQLGS